MIRRVTVLTLLGLAVGCIVALVAVGFVDGLLWLNDRLFISPRSRMLAGDPAWLALATLAVPTLGGLVVGLLCSMIPGGRPHAPADAIRAAQSLGAPMPVKAGMLTAIAAFLSLGSGASVGQYGPLVHIGASLGSWMSRIAGGGRYLGTIGIGCGAAAAIAAAFNAPIAGLVFAHEVILRHYSFRAFAPVTVSATLGYVVANVVFERPPLFRIEGPEVASPYEYLAFIGIGITGAVLAMLFMRAVLLAGELSRRLALPGPLKTALAGLAVGLVALQIPDVLGIGKEVLRFAIIENAFAAPELAAILVAKLLLTALCLGFGFAGGVFSPALLIGILFGALAGTGAEWVYGDHHSHIAIYAVCGMVAVTSPVIGAPLTTILIVFELTRNYDVATAAMVSAAFASLVGYRIFGRSLFDVQLESQGFDLSLGRDRVMVEQRTVREFLSSDYTVVSAVNTLAQARDALLEGRRSAAYVVDESGKYMGSIVLNRLMELAASGGGLTDTVAKHAQPDALVLSPGDSIWKAMSMLEDFVGESIPVLEEGRLAGVVFEGSIVKAYLETLNDLRREENAAA
ncbi:MAG TPA: chloride channel protein [Gammaproteobacteria bacterium]|nr:chloride channel protein [Gammaproteobacteria bacterium]